MENIISRIIELNRQADQKIQEAQTRKEQIIAEANAEAETIRNDSIQRSQNRMSKVDETERKAAEVKIQELEKKKDDIIAKYEALYQKNHIEWENEFFSHITG